MHGRGVFQDAQDLRVDFPLPVVLAAHETWRRISTIAAAVAKVARKNARSRRADLKDLELMGFS